jgi:CheY-like chemotaxis protein
MSLPRVLLVDDEPAIRLALKKWFERHGWAVDEAIDGHSANCQLDAVHTGYGLVICDVHLPGASGLEIATRVQSLWPELLSRFVFSTGDNMEFAPEQRILQERTRVLLKPFEFSSLRTLLNEVAEVGETAA